MVTLFLFVITGKFSLMLVTGQTYIPTWVYNHLTPWQTDQKSPWNVLAADGLFEFLPWRQVVMEAVASGHLPLVNPYAASTLGGQPLLANGQSGFFYPLHWPFWMFPTSLAPVTLMVSILVHMVILTLGTYLLARRLSASHVGAVIAAIGFSQSATLITWLPLATHLTVLAWLPWMWLASLNKSYKSLVIVTAMSMLAGHLQIAMYSILTTGIITIAVHWRKQQSGRLTIALIFGLMLSVCQLLPSVELGQQSHRGGVAASPEGYAAYISNAMPLHHFVTWLVPNYFGNPNVNGGTTWLLTNNGVPNNYAEWALYTGVLIPVLLVAGLFTFKAMLREQKVILFVAFLSILVAVGSPLCAVLYYGIPGFAATGNPARVLPILSLTMSLLAGAALHRLRLRHLTIGAVTVIVLAVVCQGLANLTVQKLSLPKDVTSAISADAFLTQAPLIALSLILAAASLFLRKRFPYGLWILPCILLGDLWLWSASYHPVGSVRDAIKTTPGIEFLKQNASQSPIACIVGNWSIGSASPNGATIPPNILSLHQLHDIATYDSLLLRKDKTNLEGTAGVSLMPPENGNLMRIPTIEAAISLGANWIVLPQLTEVPSGWDVAYSGGDMTIIHRVQEESSLASPRQLATPSLRLGIFVSLLLSTVIFLTITPSRKSRVIT
ncbi:MAG: hypothetical protein RLZZ78_709 [Armatimonadota bacterium]